ncbi:transmembrane protein, putative (macronuclear) [Tetrahymena thermophila SB210]|uniref:Transmembrane protein, putative n=1 Tax=Tetrahymena thermophila (strain SB210) TaxID=312017 RepID=Q22W35_TETTS|nr:transmembrane protein, putative [Tetrahymena thermophila SB210]EAR89582.3 transmembrane protein, putative [Tetrahymena thermophila SB210]|eukprot:XP_001009827.3 transmembrane protein, putative [Tetrahymena thermophila SB210]
MKKKQTNKIIKKAFILFLLSAIFGLVIHFIQSYEDQNQISDKSSKKRILLSSSGIEACQFINYDINDGSVKTKGTDNALSYLKQVRPVNKMITPLQSGSNDDWDSYLVSLVPMILPFFLVSVLCFFTWIGCLSQIIFKSCCRCCKRDLYRNPYTKRSIFWYMLLTIVFLVLCIMSATVSIIQLEYTFQDYQQLHCQGYLLFDHFLNGDPSAKNWIGINQLTNNLVTVQSQIASQIKGFIPSKSQASDDLKQKLQNEINTMFDSFKNVQIPDPSSVGKKLNLDSYITLEAQGFNNIQSLVLNDFQQIIAKISDNLNSLQSTATNLDNNSAQNTQFIQQKKTQIDQFTVLMQQAQSHVSSQFEKGYNFFFWYRVSMYVILGILLFCCLFTFISFIIIYVNKIKCLEPFVNFVWSFTSLLAIIGFFGSGVIYTLTIVFYEASLSFNSFTTDQATFTSMQYLLDPSAAKYLQDCVFGSNTSMIDVFGLRDYLTQVNSITLYIQQLDQSFGGLKIPNLAITNQIQDCANYINNIGSLVPNQSSSTLQLLNNCINKNQCICDSTQPTDIVSCKQVLLSDTFVFTSSQCYADGVKRFILSQGQENQNLSTQNCILIAMNTLDNNLQTTQVNNLDYAARLKNVDSIDQSPQCQKLKQCSQQNYIQQLINYASQSGYQIQQVKQTLKLVQSDFIDLYQQYYKLFYVNVKGVYTQNLEAQILLVSDSNTGMYSNLQCTAFGDDLKQMNRFLTNQFLFDLYALDWWTISTFVGMITGLTLMYFSMSRLQYWAYLDGQIQEKPINTDENKTNKPLLQQSNTIATPKKQVQEIQNTSIVNSSMLKSYLINQSTYNKKYLPKTSSFTNFQYQESLPNFQDTSMPQNITITQQNEVTKDIEMEYYKN